MAVERSGGVATPGQKVCLVVVVNHARLEWFSFLGSGGNNGNRQAVIRRRKDFTREPKTEAFTGKISRRTAEAIKKAQHHQCVSIGACRHNFTGFVAYTPLGRKR